MDRNEQFRKKIEARLNKSSRIGTRLHSDFDPSPYVDIIMDKLNEDENLDLTAVLDVSKNAQFNFIFGKSSALNSTQKQEVMLAFTNRVLALQDFDTSIYVNELSDMYGTPEFAQFSTTDDEGNKALDLGLYFNRYDLTKEQKELIATDFLEKQHKGAIANRKKIFPYLLLTIGLVLVFPFFVPNLLQKMGVLSADTGWLFKIFITLLSGIILFMASKKIIVPRLLGSLISSKANQKS